MNLQDLEAVNAETLEALQKNPGKVDSQEHPYFGYYVADIFECPPFLMFTNNDCPRAWDILFGRSFEPYSMKLWCRLARTATGILDIGAHVGVYGLAAAALRNDIQIHAFEPNPHAYARLRVHKKVNGFMHLVEHPVAVGNTNSIVHFSWTKKPTLQIASGAGVAKTSGDKHERTIVPMETLDNTGLAATLGKRPLVKIDVEGGELRTIEGMAEVLALKPDIILETFFPEFCDGISALLKPYGYNFYIVREKKGVLEQADKLTPRDPFGDDLNQLITTHSADELARLLAD